MRILLETNKTDKDNQNNYLFKDPSFIIECHKLAEVKTVFRQMEEALAKGFYLAGFLSYEAGYAFEKIFRNDKTYDFPLICFGAYSRPSSPLNLSSPCLPQSHIKTIRGEGVRTYLSALHKIKQYLADGKTYQVNHTFKRKFTFSGSPFNLYQKLKIRQPASYSAFIEADDFSILSLSPELFFRKKGGVITVKPMKGTIEPGKGRAVRLKNDPKNRSENIMIVDLLRNDLGRIAKTGTVETQKLFTVEKYKTLYQMTSTVSAKIPPDLLLEDIFKNIFPSGSVTGAPKISAMKIIQELEKEERKIYTGAIGFITPEKNMVFNVAIRTLLLTSKGGELGIGSGIVYDSDPEKELAECRLKAKFLDLAFQ